MSARRWGPVVQKKNKDLALHGRVFSIYMLLDLFTSLTASCSPYIRAMGYLDEAIAMRNRYRQRQDAWQPHLDRTRGFVLSIAEKCKKRNTVVILGSGLLLDVPLSEIASLFREVILMDVVCLPEVRKILKQHENARFIEHDVTNIAERIYNNKQYGIHELPEPVCASPKDYEYADLVVSLNILSQLTVIPRQYAVRQLPGLSGEQVNEWCRAIVQSHYTSLLSLACPVCMVSDFESVKRDREGAIFSRESTIADLKLPAPDAAWTWHIEPVQNRSQFHSKELNVGGWHLGQK